MKTGASNMIWLLNIRSRDLLANPPIADID